MLAHTMFFSSRRLTSPLSRFEGAGQGGGVDKERSSEAAFMADLRARI
jgi:hypothetical protein